MRVLPPTGAMPIERAIEAALRAELDRQAGGPRPRSTHPIAVEAQDRRRVARLAQKARELREAERRRFHRLAFQAALIAAAPEPRRFWWQDA